ncbi:MAG: LPS export ABC transporter periplasmic protein LptC, partial [Candidatus Omnitrophica bacterium]|nr:LPS export ABC transporter periplasmic protein LptC [Candidatus Omnitrophota bacterium]
MFKKCLFALIIFISIPAGLYAIEPSTRPLYDNEKTGQKTIQELQKSISSIQPTAEETASEERATPIVVNGDKVQYDYAEKTVSGTGNVSITYKGIKLTCDSIVINVDEKEGVAEGNVTLYQEGNTFTSDKVVYNFATQKGELINGAMKMPPWYGEAKLIQKTGDKLYQLNRSYVTTCDLAEPHYRIEAKTIKVYLGERVTMWNAFFLLGNVPVMYIPYYNHPLKDNMPQMDIVPGYDKEWGAYALTSWRYFFHPDSKGHINLDYRSKRGLGEGADYSYKLDKFGTGYARFYYTHDREPPDAAKKDRWRAQWRHRWQVDQNSLMTAEYHKLSDKDLIKDFFYKEEYEVDEEPPTYLSYVGAKDNYSFEILADKRINRFFTVTEKLPEAKMKIAKLKLFNFMNLYYQDSSSVARLNKNFADDLPGSASNNDYQATRIDSYNELSYPFRVLGFLNLNPFVGIRETYYSENPLDEKNIVRNMFTSGAELYARFYKIYDMETNWLGLDIHDI